MANTAIQPPPSTLQSLLGSAYKWLVDTINKISNIQSQANAALAVIGLTVKNNNPTGTDISWSACTVWLNGVNYPIAAGNTTGGSLFVWWNVGDTAFTSGASFTPSPTTFPILTNVAGTADTTWDKVGASSIQPSQVIGGLLPPGYQVQSPATANIATNLPTTILNYTGGGALLNVGLAWNASTSGGISLSINIDGAGAQVYTISSANNPNPDPVTQAWALSSALAGTVNGNQGLVTFFNIPFKSSIVLQITATLWVSGQIQVTAGWAKKL